jgi:hypothetical protein
MAITDIMVVSAAGSFLIAVVGLCINITKERRERGITTSPPPCSFLCILRLKCVILCRFYTEGKISIGYIMVAIGTGS